MIWIIWNPISNYNRILYLFKMNYLLFNFYNLNKMKKILSIQILSLFLLFSACTPTPNTEGDSENNSNTENLAEGMEEVVAIAYTQCASSCDVQSGGSFEIDKSCADCYTGNFATNRYQFPQVNGGPTQGYSIQIAELREILNDVTDPNAELFGMLGIKDFEGTEDVTPGFVFVLQESTGTRYFDFTTPCPNLCPK